MSQAMSQAMGQAMSQAKKTTDNTTVPKGHPMNNLFIASASRKPAIDASMDVLPPKQINVVLDISGDVVTATAAYAPADTGQEFFMKTPPVSSTNTTGIRGVSKVKNGYRADITRNGTQTNLGTYDSFQDAVEARLVAQWGLS